MNISFRYWFVDIIAGFDKKVAEIFQKEPFQQIKARKCGSSEVKDER
ncbi:MAG: hypothetical protein ABFR82_08550 [Nitrospirota bacterium]